MGAAQNGRSTKVAVLATFLALALHGTAVSTPANQADAAGGTSIANAPTVAFGGIEAGGGGYQDFFRLPVFAGDNVIFRFDVSSAPNNNGFESAPRISLYAPSVDDYTVRSTRPVATVGSEEGIEFGKSQYSATMSFTGLGTLDIQAHEDAALNPYTFVAYDVHAVTMDAAGPRIARWHSTARVTVHLGSPAGQPQGQCLIAGRLVRASQGRCSTRVRFGVGGRQIVRVQFVPDEGWQAASGHLTIRLIR
jgi:hypothetical protein